MGACRSRANTDDRLPADPLGRIESRDGIVEGCDVADVRPQPSVPHPPDEAYVRSKGMRAAYFIVDVTRDRLDRISAMVERGRLKLPVGEVLDLADASTAHRMLDGAPHKPGKIVLKVAD